MFALSKISNAVWSKGTLVRGTELQKAKQMDFTINRYSLRRSGSLTFKKVNELQEAELIEDLWGN